MIGRSLQQSTRTSRIDEHEWNFYNSSSSPASLCMHGVRSSPINDGCTKTTYTESEAPTKTERGAGSAVPEAPIPSATPTPSLQHGWGTVILSSNRHHRPHWKIWNAHPTPTSQTQRGRGGRERPGGSWPPLAAACVGSDAKAWSTRRRMTTTGWRRREIAMGAGGRRAAHGRGTDGRWGRLGSEATGRRPRADRAATREDWWWAEREKDPLPTAVYVSKAACQTFFFIFLSRMPKVSKTAPVV